MQTKAVTFGQTQGLRAPVQHRAPVRSRQVVMAAQKGPHEGVMKVALAAAAAAQLFSSSPAIALGNIKGIEPSRNREEDKAARQAMDAAEDKQPAVQSKFFEGAKDAAGAIKTGAQKPESKASAGPTSALNEKIDEASKPFQRAKGALDAVKGGNLPTAFGGFDTKSLQINVGAPGSTSAEGGKQIGGGAASQGGEKDAFNLQGPGTNQNRAAEIQNLNPAKAADNLKNKVKNALPTSGGFTAPPLVNVGLFDKVGDAVDAAKGAASDAPSAVGAAKRTVSSAQDDAINKLGEKAGSLTDGRLKDELQNTKDKAPYIQGAPRRAGPEILNLDEPTKKIQSEASKLKNQITTAAPAFWGSDLQVNVGYSTESQNVAPNASKIDAGKLADTSRKGDAAGAAAEFGPGQQSATSNPGGTRPRSTETSDFRAGEANQSPEAKFGAPTAIAKKISGQETV